MKRSLVVVLLGALFAVIVAVSAYLVLGPFRPEDELRRMLVTMGETPSFAWKSGVSWTRDAKEARETTTLYTSGKARLDAAEGLEHAAAFRLVRVRRGQIGAEDVSGEWRRINGLSYVTYVPPGVADLPIVFAKKDTWVKLDDARFKEWGPLLPGLGSPVTAFQGLSALDAEAWARLRGLLSRSDVVNVSFDGLTELIGGANTRVV